MSDPVSKIAEEWLRRIKGEFAIASRKLKGTQIPPLRVRISDRPQNAHEDVNLLDHTCSRPVYAEFQRLVLDPEMLRVYFDEHKRHPWFDLVFHGDNGSLTFEVSVAYPAAELKSAV
jgi:hypothetical protein